MKITARTAFMTIMFMVCATGYSQLGTVTKTYTSRDVQNAYSRGNPMANYNKGEAPQDRPQQQRVVGGSDVEQADKKAVDDASKLLQQSIRQLEMATTPEQVDDILRRQPGGAYPATFKALKKASIPILKICNPEVLKQPVAKNTAEVRNPTARVQVSPEPTPAIVETKASPKIDGVNDLQNDGWPQVKLSSIAKGGGKKMAMINGKFVGVGDEINGLIVTEIKDYSVKMKKGAETRELQVGK